MAAGQGFKTFTTGEVLTAGDVNGYLMQGVLVFASAAARNAAITSPQEGQFAYTKDTNGLWYYDGAAWVASGATGDIEGVTAGVGISGGGTSGTVTVTNSMATAMTTKGDLVVATGSGTFQRQAVGANGTVLTADSAEADGVKWATPATPTPTYIGAIAYGAVNLSWSSTATAVSNLTTEIVDTNNFHSTSSNTSRMTIPTGYDGKYFMAMDMNLAATGGSSPNMYIRAYKNGAQITEGLTAGNLGSFLSAQGQDAHWNVSLTVTGVANDYFEFFVIMGGGSSTIDKARYTFTYLGA